MTIEGRHMLMCFRVGVVRAKFFLLLIGLIRIFLAVRVVLLPAAVEPEADG
jgi:hypothetical protein